MNLQELLAANFEQQGQNLFFQPGRGDTTFEDAYISLREKEGRLLSDDVVRKLPAYDGPYRSEWDKRRKSSQRFINYIANRSEGNVLEIGCGNGWFSHLIASSNRNLSVLGSDINSREVRQGAKVFPRPNLMFLLADILSVGSLQGVFHMIVFASSLQYFRDLEQVFACCSDLLREDGEVHILDTPFYPEGQVESARHRSRKYFEGSNPQMINYYFHHSKKEMEQYQPTKLYSPGLLQRITADSPFPWIKIERKNLLSSPYRTKRLNKT